MRKMFCSYDFYVRRNRTGMESNALWWLFFSLFISIWLFSNSALFCNSNVGDGSPGEVAPFFIEHLIEEYGFKSCIEHDAVLKKAIDLKKNIQSDDVVMCVRGEEEPFLLDYDFVDVAKEKHQDLRESILFSTSFLKKTRKVRDFLLDRNHFGGKHREVRTTDGETIHYTYFDRGSDTLLVIGGGFLNQERVASFIKMFNRYDILIFNHRGVEYEGSSILKPSTWGYVASSSCVFEGLNGKKVMMGREEEKDVFAVVDDLLNRKNKGSSIMEGGALEGDAFSGGAYKNVYGIALCYSAPIFVKAAVLRPKLFDKLVLDGGWLSVERMIDTYVRTLGGDDDMYWLQNWVPSPTDGWLFDVYKWLGEKVSGVNLRKSRFSFAPYFRRLKIPVLFFHSVNDCLVSDEELKDVYSLVPTEEKIAVLMMNGHIRNYLKQGEVYKELIDNFFKLSFCDFTNKLM